jgi:secondary thiamine-phosphate synthase enzyme
MWLQREIRLAPRKRGFHLITRDVVDALPEVGSIGVGLVHILIAHTSASLAVNENADPDVRRDLEAWFSGEVPEDWAWTHTDEGPDDMPAHVKAILVGPSVTLPIGGGRVRLGTWQGIYLCEHRDSGGPRTLVATVHGE